MGRKALFLALLQTVFAVNNKWNWLKIKGMKVYSSKQLMTSCGGIKTKMYKIEDHQDLSSSWKWRIFTFASTMKCKSLQIYFFQVLWNRVICVVIEKIKSCRLQNLIDLMSLINICTHLCTMKDNCVRSLLYWCFLTH